MKRHTISMAYSREMGKPGLQWMQSVAKPPRRKNAYQDISEKRNTIVRTIESR